MKPRSQAPTACKCPWCGYFICMPEKVPLPGVRRRCRGCGSWVFLSARVLKLNRRACPCCGLVVRRSRRRCPRCGTKLKRGLLSWLRKVFSGRRPRVKYVDIEKIRTEALLARRALDLKRFEILMRSIERFGILVPLLVRPSGKAYELISGHKRLLAARKLGLREVPVVVRNATSWERVQLRLIDNLTQEGLTDLDTAEALEKLLLEARPREYKELLELLDMRFPELRHLLRPLTLPEVLKDALALGLLSVREARELEQNGDPEVILAMLENRKAQSGSQARHAASAAFSPPLKA